MTSRERILAAIDHKVVDRIPSDIWATPEIWKRLEEHFSTEDHRQIKDKLGIDGFEKAPIKYIGHDWTTLSDGTQIGPWGTRWREQAVPTGGKYLEQFFYPLQDVTDMGALNDFNWGNPFVFDFEGTADWCRHHRQYAIEVGCIEPFSELTKLFNTETALMNLALHPEFMEAVLERVMEYHLQRCEMLYQATKGHADITQVSDDLATQNGLLMSHDMIRTFFWPHHRNAIRLAQKYGLKVMHHDDGAMSDLIPDLIDMGVDILNPIQRKCPGMDLSFLKKEYGKDLCFHGSVENQEILPFGTPEEVRKEVRNNIHILGNDGTGLIIAPCHNIQWGTPLENVLALYEEVRVSGVI